MASKRLNESHTGVNLRDSSNLKKQKISLSPIKASSITTSNVESNEVPRRSSSLIDQVNEEDNNTRPKSAGIIRANTKSKSPIELLAIDPLLTDESRTQHNRESGCNSDLDSDSNSESVNDSVNSSANGSDSDDENVNTDADDEVMTLTETIPSTKTLSSLFQGKELLKLSKVLKNIESCIPIELKEYKKSVEVKERRGDKLISQLFKENEQLKNRIIELKTKVHEIKRDNKSILRDAENEISRWKTLIISSSERSAELENQIINLKHKLVRSTNDDFEDDEDEDNVNVDINEQALNMVNRNHNLKKDKDLQINFLELLTGVRCIGFEESSYTLNFTVKQSGGVGTIYYKLIISKKIEERSEAIYIPIWDKHIDFEGDWDENVNNVKKYLPEYLHDELTFPSNAINYFNSKLNDCLNQ